MIEDLLAGIIPVFDWHIQVKENKVIVSAPGASLIYPHEIKRLLSIVCGINGVNMRQYLQKVGDDKQLKLVIIRNKYFELLLLIISGQYLMSLHQQILLLAGHE